MSEPIDTPEWFVSTAPDAVEGPLPAGHLREMAATGRLRSTDAVRHQAWSAWFPASEVALTLGIASFSTAAPVAPTSRAAFAPAEPVVPLIIADAVRTTPPSVSVAQPTYPAECHDSSTDASTITASQRFASWAIDAGVLFVGALIVNAILPNVITAVVMFGAYAAYTVLLPVKNRATIGHVAMGFRVQPTEGTHLDPIALATRYSVVLLLSLPCLVGTVLSAISMTAHSRSQAWHDVASGTTLVRVKPFQFGRSPIDPVQS
jgi:uncharacterized RDD family membrane protein YckC